MDLHPESLLDRARSGSIDEWERATLEAHARRCASCAFALQLAADDERAAAVLSPKRVDALVDRVLARETHVEQVPPRRRTAGMLAVAAAALAFVAVTAGAVLAYYAASRSEHVDRPVLPTPARAPKARRAEPPPPAVPPAPPTAAREAPPPQTAASLLAAAGTARNRRETGRALALYRRLQRRFPASDEARISHVSAGRLYLDRLAQPQRAVAQFDRYLATGDRALELEALVGRAESLSAVGSPRAQEAWAVIARRYPNSPHAREARRRIDANE